MFLPSTFSGTHVCTVRSISYAIVDEFTSLTSDTFISQQPRLKTKLWYFQCLLFLFCLLHATIYLKFFKLLIICLEDPGFPCL